MWNEIYDLLTPILSAALVAVLSALIPWACTELRGSPWYQKQNWLVKKLIDFFVLQIMLRVMPMFVVKKTVDIALEKPVRQMMPEAEKLKSFYPSGVMPLESANDLRDRAVNTALNQIIMLQPEIDNKIDSKKLVETIEGRVAPVVDKVKAKRKAARLAMENHRRGK